MRNAKVEAVELILNRNGFEVPRDVIIKALAAADDQPSEQYEVGDFVCVYDGMGEISHGTVLSFNNKRKVYYVDIFDYGIANASYRRNVSDNDMRGISTPEEAMDYFRVRSGG